MKAIQMMIAPESGYGVLPEFRWGFRPPLARAGTHAQSIRSTVAMHDADPGHRFHGGTRRADSRILVAAGRAVQRMRGRHFGSSVR